MIDSFFTTFSIGQISPLYAPQSLVNVDSSSRLQLFAKQSKKNELTFYELEMAFLTLARQETGTTANIDDVSISLEKDKWIRIQMCAPLAFGDQAMEQYFQTCKSYDRYFKIAGNLSFNCGNWKRFLSKWLFYRKCRAHCIPIKIVLQCNNANQNLSFCLSLLNHEKW